MYRELQTSKLYSVKPKSLILLDWSIGIKPTDYTGIYLFFPQMLDEERLST